MIQTGIATAQQVIVAIDDIEDSMLIVRHLRLNYPEISLWVRARDRHHVHLLQDLGVKHIWRETYLSALELSQALLNQLNPDPEESLQQIQNFREQDEKLLNSQYHLDPDEHQIMKISAAVWLNWSICLPRINAIKCKTGYTAATGYKRRRN